MSEGDRREDDSTRSETDELSGGIDGELTDLTGSGDDGVGLREKARNLREWLLLDGSRLVVAGLLLAATVGLLVAAELLGLIPMARQQPAFYVMSSLIGGNLTLVTVVVSINQLLLSRELSTPGQLRSQIDEVIEYREEVEEHAGGVAPVKPLGFLELLFANTRREAQRIGGMTFGAVGDEVRTEVDETVEALTDHADHVEHILDESDPDTFRVLSVTLTTNYAQQINRIRRIRATHGDELPETVMDALDNLIDHLQKVDVARQYFKSLYLQEELSSLSRVLLYAGFPAEVALVLALLGFTAAEGTALTHHSNVLMPVVVGIAFLPLALLLAFIVRIATVTERTAATIPFTTPKQEQ
ncbi:hypothetical protein [Halorussus salinus]|uniref:hypothetical protein n=1 Tax=Halorussus salinus TaxID=1364935 RepID=UPI001EE47803|nr:hypothetical protein [Halorussus salinus]